MLKGLREIMINSKYYIEMGTAAVLYQGSVYFSGIRISGLYKLNVTTGEVTLLCGFENEVNAYQLHSKAYLYGEEIWFMPYEAKYIACVNIESLNIIYYDLPDSRENENGKAIYGKGYYDSVRINSSRIFLTPTAKYTTLILDMKNKKIEQFNNIPKKKDEIIGYCSISNEKVLLSPIKGDNIYSINLQTGEMDSIEAPFSDSAFSGGCICGDSLWLSPHKADQIRCVNLRDKSYFDYSMGDIYDSNYTFRGLLKIENELWILPWNAPYILIFDLETKQFHKKCLDEESLGLHYMMKIETDDNTGIFSEGSYGKIVKLDGQYNCEIIKSWMFSPVYIDGLRKLLGDDFLIRYTEITGGVLTDKNFGLECFINSIIE